NSIMVGKFPSCILNVRVRPEVVDINVHPAKTEVRFSDERKVSSAVYFAVKSALESFDTMPELNLSRAAKVTQRAMPESVQLSMLDDEPEKKAYFSGSIFTPKAEEMHKPAVKSEPKKDFWQSMPAKDFANKTVSAPVKNEKAKTENEPDLVAAAMQNVRNKNEEMRKAAPVVNEQKAVVSSGRVAEKAAANTPSYKPQQANINTQTVKTEPANNVKPQQSAPAKPQQNNASSNKPIRLLGEVFKTYVICEFDGKVVMIDKHAAHERIIYNKMKAAAKENISSQVLLSAVKVTLNKNEYTAVIENLDAFKSAGYLIEDFGDGVVVVRECPMLISGDDVEDTVIEMAAYLGENRTNIETETIDRIHHTAACKAAIKAGYKNSTAEMKVLAEQVLYDDSVRYCPHGRPVLIELSKYELEKQFGRIQ
ncbi:MAG: hypothetical protein J6Q79_07970, partial [Clostridia bacterium]|nr:hypothetical protein [Clostridia bacterium]